MEDMKISHQYAKQQQKKRQTQDTTATSAAFKHFYADAVIFYSCRFDEAA